MSVIDLTMTIDNDCMTCGTPWHAKVEIEQLGRLGEVGRNTSRFVLGSHTATHMDAPRHFFDTGHGIDTTDLERCMGPVSCVDFRGIGAEQKVRLDDVRLLNITERMLFVFGWNKYWKTNEYYRGFPYFTREAAQYLIDSGIKLLALDTPSPDDGSAITEFDDSPVHKMLLQRDIVIVEYLTNTEHIDFAKNYEIIALPLKILNSDGAPARVVLKEV